MNAQHTPGPWSRFTTYAHIEVRDASGRLVAVVGSGSGCNSPAASTAADARLIAAAPTLLDALQALVDEYEPNIKAFATGAPRKAKWAAALATIAKATRSAA